MFIMIFDYDTILGTHGRTMIFTFDTLKYHVLFMGDTSDICHGN
jgi:hypothetical protein